MTLTNANHVSAEKALQRQGDENLEGERAAERDQAEKSDDSRGGVDRVEGNLPFFVPVSR